MYVAQKYMHIFRRKRRWELIILNFAMCGIGFCNAVEAAYVTPILLSLGLNVKFATMIWCISPAIGFLITPTLGSLSDRCTLSLGRRKPFIILFSFGIIIGLIFIPYGELIGLSLGNEPVLVQNISDFGVDCYNKTGYHVNTSVTNNKALLPSSQPWGIFFTVLGIILLDFCSDAAQSPARAYLLDVTVQEDHSIGLSTFTSMAGLGGFFGYLICGIDWDVTNFGFYLGGHVKTVFVFIAFIFIICSLFTITSFSEMPLNILIEYESKKSKTIKTKNYETLESESEVNMNELIKNYNCPSSENSALTKSIELEEYLNLDDEQVVKKEYSELPTLKQYLLSIVFMPKWLRILCLENFFSWMSYLSYNLYFTDFVGEIVFGGDPAQPKNSNLRKLYDDGVKFANIGLALFSSSCFLYSHYINWIIHKFGMKSVYISGQVIYLLGMILMTIFRHKIVVISLSTTVGLMYANLFSIPYFIVSHFHSTYQFPENTNFVNCDARSTRGIGTDVAVINSMVFLAQFLLSLSMGTIIKLTNSSASTMYVAALLSACAAFTATRIFYE